MGTPKFHNLHARVGHVFDVDKGDGSEVLVAEIDTHWFMGNLETRQQVAELFAAAPELLASLEECSNELRQIHRHHYPGCGGGCPADAYLRRAEEVLAKVRRS